MLIPSHLATALFDLCLVRVLRKHKGIFMSRHDENRDGIKSSKINKVICQMVNACSLLLRPPAKVIHPLLVDSDAVMKYVGATLVKTDCLTRFWTCRTGTKKKGGG